MASKAKVGGVSAAVLHKRCPHCEVTKPHAAFNRNRSRPDGLQDRCRECRKAMYWRDPAGARDTASRWRKQNPERAKEAVARWVDANKDRMRAGATLRARKYRQDPAYRLKQAVYSSMSGLVGCRRDYSTKLELLGYTVEELRTHLERQFLKGMTWNNYGEWHVDHIVPLASFRIKSLDDDDFKRAWALTNLRPLWGRENESKGAKREFLL